MSEARPLAAEFLISMLFNFRFYFSLLTAMIIHYSFTSIHHYLVIRYTTYLIVKRNFRILLHLLSFSPVMWKAEIQQNRFGLNSTHV